MFFLAFSANMPTHSFHGMWRHPRSRQVEFASLDYWREFAQIAERGKLDGIFLADVVGVGEAFSGGAATTIERAMQFPLHDPMTLMSALIPDTEHLGLAFTSSTLQQHPFNFARQMATIDHLSRGRAGWNIVTSSFPGAARNLGLESLPPHDERYRAAQEYMDVTYKLWEGSWEDGALMHDAEHNVFTDPAKVHAIDHVGEFFRCAGPMVASPSPQRTPVLFQAGNSEAGRSFASHNAEVQFIMPPRPEVAAEIVADVRRRARAAGRRDDDIRFVQALSFMVGSTEEEARRVADEMDSYIDPGGALGMLSREAGINFGDASPDTLLKDIYSPGEGAHSHIQGVIDASPDGTATVRDLALFLVRQNQIVGTPEQIADKLLKWQAAGVDGVNVLSHIMPGSLEAFVDHVMPELQKRGLAQREYPDRPQTLRERLFGGDPLLNERHPAAKFRRSSPVAARA